jgi:NADH-quinone oxidoreductase subunit L
MLLGTLAITGVGIYGIGGFAGYHSKDAIIEVAWAAGSPVASMVGVFAALLTSFYSWRLMFLTFWGEPRWAASEHIQHALHDAHGHGDHAHHDHAHAHDHGDAHAHGHDDAHHPAPSGEDAGHAPHVESRGFNEIPKGTGGYHPHESPIVMLIPLIVLSIGAVAAGFVFHRWFIDPESAGGFWKGALFFNEHLMHEMHQVPLLVQLAATIVMLSGLLIAYLTYIRSPDAPAKFVDTFQPLYRFLLNKWYFDQLYHFLFVRPAFAIGRLLWHRGDEGTIDRFGPNGSAWLVQVGSRAAVRLQTGYVYTYAFVMLIGLTAAITWAIAG